MSRGMVTYILRRHDTLRRRRNLVGVSTGRETDNELISYNSYYTFCVLQILQMILRNNDWNKGLFHGRTCTLYSEILWMNLEVQPCWPHLYDPNANITKLLEAEFRCWFALFLDIIRWVLFWTRFRHVTSKEPIFIN